MYGVTPPSKIKNYFSLLHTSLMKKAVIVVSPYSDEFVGHTETSSHPSLPSLFIALFMPVQAGVWKSTVLYSKVFISLQLLICEWKLSVLGDEVRYQPRFYVSGHAIRCRFPADYQLIGIP